MVSRRLMVGSVAGALIIAGVAGVVVWQRTRPTAEEITLRWREKPVFKKQPSKTVQPLAERQLQDDRKLSTE